MLPFSADPPHGYWLSGRNAAIATRKALRRELETLAKAGRARRGGIDEDMFSALQRPEFGQIRILQRQIQDLLLPRLPPGQIDFKAV